MATHFLAFLKILKNLETTVSVVDETDQSERKMYLGSIFMAKVAFVVLVYFLGIACALYQFVGLDELGLMKKSEFTEFQKTYNANHEAMHNQVSTVRDTVASVQLRTTDIIIVLLNQVKAQATQAEQFSAVYSNHTKKVVINNDREGGVSTATDAPKPTLASPSPKPVPKVMSASELEKVESDLNQLKVEINNH